MQSFICLCSVQYVCVCMYFSACEVGGENNGGGW